MRKTNTELLIRISNAVIILTGAAVIFAPLIKEIALAVASPIKP